MSNTSTTNAPYPPQGTQILQTAGTLTGVVIPQPLGSPAGNAQIDVSFYDTPNGSTSGTPIATVKTSNGYVPVVLNVSFTTGLYAVQRSGSSIAITHTP